MSEIPQFVPEAIIENKPEQEHFLEQLFSYGDVSLSMKAKKYEVDPKRLGLQIVDTDYSLLTVTELFLKNKDGKTRSLLELMPEGYEIVIVEASEAHIKKLSREICIPSHRRTSRHSYERTNETEEDNIIPDSLTLNEQGHAELTPLKFIKVNETTVQETTYEPYWQNPAVLFAIFHEREHALRSTSHGRDLMMQLLEKAMAHDSEQPNSEEKQLAKHEEELACDRSAFAMLNELKEDGFDVKLTLENQEFREWIRTGLKSYNVPENEIEQLFSEFSNSEMSQS